jgi:hypothetical protein
MTFYDSWPIWRNYGFSRHSSGSNFSTGAALPRESLFFSNHLVKDSGFGSFNADCAWERNGGGLRVGENCTWEQFRARNLGCFGSCSLMRVVSLRSVLEGSG